MVILNNEGAGNVCGIYNGKQSPLFSKGKLNGGAYCRWIVNELQKDLDFASIPYVNICPELYNIDLATRIKRLNNYVFDTSTFALSIYAGTSERSGIRVLANNHTQSKSIASVLYNELSIAMDNYNMKVHKINFDLEHEHTILFKANCPSFIIYAGSVDLVYDYKRMVKQEFHSSIASALLNTIQSVCES